MAHPSLPWKISTFAALGACAFLALHPPRSASGTADAPHAQKRQNGFIGSLLGAPEPDSLAERHVGQHLQALYASTTSQATCEALQALAPGAGGDEEATTAIGERTTEKWPFAVRGCAIDALSSVRTGAARSWLGDLLSDKDREVRKRAIHALADSDDDEARRMLLGVARSGSGPDRFEAVVALGTQHVREAGPLIVAELGRTSGVEEQRELVQALGESGDPAAMTPLLQLAAHGPASLRSAALEALGSMGGEGAAGALEQAMLSGGREDTAAAAQALGRMKDGKGKAALISAAKDSRRSVSSAALRALAELDGDDVRDVMLGALGGGEEARAAAVQWFASKRDPSAIPKLTELASKSTTATANEALAALVTIGTDDAIAAVQDVASKPGPLQGQALAQLASTPGGAERSRALAIRLVKEGGQNASSALGVLEGDTSPEARAALIDLAKGTGTIEPSAMATLARSGDPEAMRVLSDLARSGKPSQRLNAVSALGSTADPHAVPVLAAALREGDAGLRRTAINALVEIGGADAERAVLDATTTGDVGVKMVAVTALGRLGTAGAQGQLERLAQEKDPNVARVALSTLAQHAPERAGALVDRAMSAEDKQTRLNAMNMVPMLDVTTARRVVMAGLRDADDQVALTAVQQLGDMGGPEARSALEGVLSDARASEDRKRAAADQLVDMGAEGGAMGSLVQKWRTPESDEDDERRSRFRGEME